MEERYFGGIATLLLGCLRKIGLDWLSDRIAREVGFVVHCWGNIVILSFSNDKLRR